MVFLESSNFTVYTGPMFCGKTDRLVTDLKNYERAGVPYLAFKPDFDTRTATISTRSGRGSIPAKIIPRTAPEHMLDYIDGEAIIGVDEINFFEPYIAEILHDLTLRGKHVLVSGLNLDFRAMPFEATARALAYANKVETFTAVCMAVVGCRVRATRTQRFYTATGDPAPFADEINMVQKDLVVDGSPLSSVEVPVFDYRAVCTEHFSVPGKPGLEELIELVHR